MLIKSIELNNYRLYRGLNRIVFQNGNNKNLYIISGENGFGKTTFLHSLLWCLYGRLMADIDQTFNKEMAKGEYYNTLINNLNEVSKQKLHSEVSQNKLTRIKKEGYTSDSEYIKEWSRYSVSLEFTEVLIPSIPCYSLKITRFYDILLDEEIVEILIDGMPNELTKEIGNEIFINDFILNKDIARFFFFDSEKIVSLAETNTIEDKRKLCSAYNEVLGVKKYEDLKRNLENLRLRFRRKSDDVDSRNKLDNLISKQEILNEILEKQGQQTTHLDSQLFLLRKEDENLQMQLLREGSGVTMEELNRLESLLQNTRQKDADYKNKLKLFLEFAPFAISGKLFQQTKTQVERDINILQIKNNVSSQNSLLIDIANEMQETYKNVALSENIQKKLMTAFNNIVAKYNDSTDEKPLLSVSKEDFDEFISIYSNLTTTYRVEFEHLADDYRKNKLVVERTARNISNMHFKENDNIIKKIRRQKNDNERKIAELELKIRQTHENRGAQIRELEVLSRQISELSKKVSVDDSDSKKDKVAEQLIKELLTFLVALKNKKKSALEGRIKTTMNNLMHKTDFIGDVDIVIVEDVIDINLFSNDKVLIKKESLSKGEQQLYATALLKALVEESGIQFPVFIDSPLQKFDKSHANKIITEFYPTISKQVILFPLLYKELTKNELETMKPYINSVYLLKNENSCSFIEQIDVNNLMNE